MTAIQKGDIDRLQAQAVFQNETMLRQKANGLYIDAASCVVANLAASQERLMGVVAEAKATIKTVKEIAAAIDLVADLLVLAAAAYAAKPGPILSALKDVKEDVDALKTA
ncbi:MAG: hypothetical protein M3436_17180 [Pseudomonadota bacterium]|nr:hypothetical protein [Pseudomonadota bacterium]